MSHAELPAPLRGMVPPMATPLLDSDTLDVEGVGRLIEHILAGGVSGLFIMGTTGEGPSSYVKCLKYALSCMGIRGAAMAPPLQNLTEPQRQTIAENLKRIM